MMHLLNNLDAYLIAYVAEGICFVAAIALRLYWDHCSGCGVSIRQAELKSTSLVSVTSGDIMEERYCDYSTQHPHKQVKSRR